MNLDKCRPKKAKNPLKIISSVGISRTVCFSHFRLLTLYKSHLIKKSPEDYNYFGTEKKFR